MNRTPKFLRTLLMAAVALAALPARAQLNPKWQTTAVSPDFLNLYQQSNSQILKPEIVTVLDFSGSMESLMYHSAYPNQDNSDSDPGGTITFTMTGSNYTNYTVSASISITYGSRRYPITDTYTGSQLIRPDGKVLDASLINANYQWKGYPAEPASYAKNSKDNTTWPSYYIQNWVRSASHVRMTQNGRTYDIPIPWTILDDFSVQPNRSARDTRQVWNTYPLKMTIEDPMTQTPVELDATYQHGGQRITLESIWVSTGWGRGYYTYDHTTCKLSSGPASYDLIYRKTFMNWIFYQSNPLVQSGASGSGYAFKGGIPARTRTQAVKEAFLRTWIKYYDKVFWANRFLRYELDPNGWYPPETNQGVNLCNDTHNDMSSTVPTDTTTYVPAASQRAWVLMRPTKTDSLNGMQRIAHYFAGSGTPLTYAMGNALAQYNDPNSVFNSVEVNPGDTGLDDTPKECTKHFLILFTDGQPNNDGGGESMLTPYLGSDNKGDSATGNKAINDSKGSMNPVTTGTNTYWNIMNLAAVAAHGGELMTLPTYPAAGNWPDKGATSVDQWLPFWIKRRGTVSFSMAHPITTMTVGVSLAGTSTDSTGSKARLFWAAAFGDPLRKTWDLTTLKPFQLSNPSDPTSKPDPNSVYFFDAGDPSTLVNYLDRAFKIATEAQNATSTTAPVIPTMGAGLGTQVYVGKFQPPQDGGPIWPGDLMMFPTRQVNGQTQIVDKSGNQVSGALSDTAAWSAAKILVNKTWKNRVIYTRLPATSSTPMPPLVKVLMSGSTPTNDPGYTSIKSLIPGSDDTAKFSAWSQFVGCSDGTANGSTRADIMGDVIGSTPAVLGYDGFPNNVSSTTLSSAWGDGKNKQFNMIFVGDNQGFLHAFGEVSWGTTATDASNKTVSVTAGVADELWAFVPTDILPYIDYYRASSNSHRYSVDGSPTVYLMDVPQDPSQVTGDGKYSLTGSSAEEALVIFGLGKGGRSYYAIDVRDPANPRFQENSGHGWSLCPDEPANYTTSRFSGDSGNLSAITNMGYSSSIPTPARMLQGSTSLVKDYIFLGGGYSVPEIELNYPSTGSKTKLGRSVVALEATTGKIARVWDLSGISGIGPIATGIVPYEFVQGSGLDFRAYFTDYFGGLWALGSSAVSSDTLTKGFRTDSPKLDSWSSTPRCLFKQAPNNGLNSTWPVPFSLPSAVPARDTDPKVSPATVGIAWVTGDRMNPMDLLYGTATYNASAVPTQHRLNVFFDRQDSNLLGLDSSGAGDSKMQDFTSSTSSDPALDPTNSSYYLKNKYGYYINFVKATSPFVTKGMIPPQLLSGTLFFSAFVPSGIDPCAGGTGKTYTYVLCDVMRPVFSNGDISDATAVNGCKSGRYMTWTGVASRFASRSPISVIQAGVNPVSTSGGSTGTGSTTDLKIQSITGNMDNLYLKPRVWRTVR